MKKLFPMTSIRHLPKRIFKNLLKTLIRIRIGNVNTYKQISLIKKIRENLKYFKSKVIQNSVNDFSEYIKNETLAKDLVFIEKIGKEKILDYDFEFKLKVSTNNS